MKRLFAHLVLLLLAPAALANDGERVLLFDLTYHTADGSITPLEIREAQWPYKLPAPTTEELDEAENTSEERRRRNGHGLVFVEAITAEGAVHYRTVQPIYLYRSDGVEVVDPSFRVRVPAEGTARIHIKGWREKTEATFELAEILRNYKTLRAAALAAELTAIPNRMNVLVMAEGYVKYNAPGRDEEALFNADFAAITTGTFGMQQVTPFRHYWSYFNIQKKFFGATQGFPGVHHPLCNNGNFGLDTNALAQAQAQANGAVVAPVFGTKFCQNLTDNVLGDPADRAAVIRKAEELMPGVNVIVLLVNDFTHDGRMVPTGGGHAFREMNSAPGFSIFVVQRSRPAVPPGPATLTRKDNNTADTFVHEMGHALFHLSDEYGPGTTSTRPSACDDAGATAPCEWNVTNLVPTAQRPVKWSLWNPSGGTSVFCDANSQTLPPTHVERCEAKTNFYRIVSVFEGARRESTGYYRPMFTCRMKEPTEDRALAASETDRDTEFCPVCKEGIMRRIYRDPAPPSTGGTVQRPAGIQLHDQQPGTQHTVPALEPAANPAPIRMIRAQFMEFKATPVVTRHQLEYSWSFNGTNLNRSRPDYYFLADKSGVLEFKIVDPMPKEPIPFTPDPEFPLVLQANRTANMQDVVRWPIDVRTIVMAESGPLGQTMSNSVDFPIAQGTEHASINWSIVTEEFANRCTGCGDEWRVIVTPAGGGGTSASSTTILFERGKIAGPDHLGLTDTATFRVKEMTANGDITLRLTTSVKSLGDDKAKTRLTAEVGGVPGQGCTSCPVCDQDPKPPECGLSLSIESLQLLPMSDSTDSDHSYVSFEPQGSVSTIQRFLRMKTTPIPADATLKTTVYIVNDKGEDVGIAVQGTFPTDRWPLERQGTARTDWSIRVTQHDGKDIKYLGKPLTHEFSYRVHLVLTLGSRSIETSAVVGTIANIEVPGLPPVGRPLHSLRRSGTRWRYAPDDDDGREAGGDNWASLAMAQWFAPISQHDGHQNDITQRIIGRMDDISREHAIRDSQHPGRHQWGTDVSIYHWYQFFSDPPRGSDIDPGRQYTKLRQYAQDAQRDGNVRAKAIAELKAWALATRAGIDRLLGQGNIDVIRHAVGHLCGGNSDPDWPFVDNLHPAFIRQLLWDGKVTLNGDANGQVLFDLGIGSWNASNASGGWVDFTCEANFESDVIMDRCKLGETPPPCGSGRRRAVRHPSCVNCLTDTTTATIGQQLTLAVTIKDDPDEVSAYRWYKGNIYDFSQPVDGGTKSSITFIVSGPEKYWVYVFNSAGFLTSGTQIVICNPPAIVGQTPTSFLTLGESTSLTVETTGSEPRRYEWFTGVSSPTTQLPDTTPTRIAVTPSVDTRYWARVTNDCGTVLSEPILVNVCEPAKIKTPPQPTTIIEGNLGSLSILATGTSPVTYQWFEGEVDGGGPQVPLCSTNVCSVRPSASTKYWAKISNNCGEDKSAAVMVTVIPRCVAPVVTAHPQPKTINKDEEVTLTAGATGTDLLYQWYVGGKGNTGTPVPNGTTNEIKVKPDTSTHYWVRVRNSCGTADSDAALVTVIGCEPARIEIQPAGATIDPGDTAELTVTAGGTEPLSYQWYRFTLQGAVEVENGNSRTVGVSPARTSSYWVEVSNACGPVARSRNVTVIVSENCGAPQITTPPPSVTSINAGDEARLEVRASGSQPFLYQWYIGASPDTGTPIDGEVNPLLVTHPLQTTTYSVRVANECGHADASATVTVPVPCDLRIIHQPTSTSLLKGQTVTLIGNGAGSGAVSLQWYSALPGGEWQRIEGATGVHYDATPDETTHYLIRATNECASLDSEIAVVTILTGCTRPEIVTQPESVTTTNNNPVTLEVQATGTQPLQYNWYEIIDGFPRIITNATQNNLTVVPTTTVRTFHVRITNSCFAVQSANVEVKLVPPCEVPSVSTPPQSQTITRGQSVTLSVEAGGTEPRSYQWYRGDTAANWTLIQGATGASLTESPQTTTYYFAQVSNACGNVSSAYAVVTVNFGCGPDGTPCGEDGHHTCQGGQCVCTDCSSPVCCGAPGNTFCDGQQHFDPNTGYTGACTSSLPACGPGNDFDGDNEVYHNGDVYACVKHNGVHEWFPRRPSPRCQEVAQVCDYLCAYNFGGGMGFQCEDNGFWSQNPPLPYCFGGTIPESFLCD